MFDNFVLIKRIYILYVFFVVFFLFVTPSKNPSCFHIFNQFYQATLVLVLAYFLFQREVIGKIEFNLGLFLYLVILITSYRLLNYCVLGDWLGVGVDGRYYTKLGTDFVVQKISIFDVFEFFKQKQVMLDDYGMSFITTSFFWFWGDEWGFHLLPYLSIIPILVGGDYLRRLSDEIDISKRQGYLLNFIWCTMSYSCYNCSIGLKENYMVCFIIISLYLIQKNIEEASFFRLVILMLFASTMLLFRTALCYMLIITLIVAFFLKNAFFRKYIWLWLGCGIIVALPLLALAINYIGGVRGGVSGQFVNDMYQSKMKMGGVFAPFLNTIVTFVGPIPSFISDFIKAKYITLFSFTSTIKLFLSFGYIYALYAIVRYRCLKLIPITIFLFLHSLMIWMMFYSLHDRYQWPQYPIVLLLAFYGFSVYRSIHSEGTLYKYYCCFAIACILFFNFRVI